MCLPSGSTTSDINRTAVQAVRSLPPKNQVLDQHPFVANVASTPWQSCSHRITLIELRCRLSRSQRLDVMLLKKQRHAILQ